MSEHEVTEADVERALQAAFGRSPSRDQVLRSALREARVPEADVVKLASRVEAGEPMRSAVAGVKAFSEAVGAWSLVDETALEALMPNRSGHEGSGDTKVAETATPAEALAKAFTVTEADAANAIAAAFGRPVSPVSPVSPVRNGQ